MSASDLCERAYVMEILTEIDAKRVMRALLAAPNSAKLLRFLTETFSLEDRLLLVPRLKYLVPKSGTLADDFVPKLYGFFQGVRARGLGETRKKLTRRICVTCGQMASLRGPAYLVCAGCIGPHYCLSPAWNRKGRVDAAATT